MNALVTGGAGFVDSNIVKSLIEEHSVTVLDNPSLGYRYNLEPFSQLKFVEGDVRHSLADVGAAHTAFAYQPTVSMEEGLREYMQWAKGVL